MILHLTNGLSTEKTLTSATMGLHLERLTLKGQDLYQLLQMSDGELRETLSILYTRFAPFSQEIAHAED